jgi:heme A synthase
LHFYNAIALFATLALHIVLHWNRIINFTRGHAGTASGWRLLLGVAALIVVILLASAPIVTPVDAVGTPRGHGFGRMQ